MKILVIEDDENLVKNISLTFRKLNIQADYAYTGDEAFSLLDIYEYDLILLDVLLPDCSGFDLLKNIRNKNNKNISTPVLILSGLDDANHKIEGLNHGADDYLTKPFNKNELIARVNALIRRSKGYSQSIIQIGELKINLDSRQVLFNDQLVKLTNKEFSIIEILAFKKGNPVSKETLLDQLYQGLDEPEPKIIDVFICKIRKKLKKISSKNYVDTIWGQGYALRDPKKN